MFVLNIISTIPMPPSSSTQIQVNEHPIFLLTSFVIIFEREAIEYLETCFCSACKAPLILIEKCVNDPVVLVGIVDAKFMHVDGFVFVFH